MSDEGYFRELADAISEVKKRGGKWKQVAEAILWADTRIETLEKERDYYLAQASCLYRHDDGVTCEGCNYPHHFNEQSGGEDG